MSQLKRRTTTGVAFVASLLTEMKVIDRRIKGILRHTIEQDTYTKAELKHVETMKLACNELKLDIRDYEYAETRIEQVKWAKIAKHNMHALLNSLMALDAVFSPADIAELSAKIEVLESSLK